MIVANAANNWPSPWYSKVGRCWQKSSRASWTMSSASELPIRTGDSRDRRVECLVVPADLPKQFQANRRLCGQQRGKWVRGERPQHGSRDQPSTKVSRPYMPDERGISNDGKTIRRLFRLPSRPRNLQACSSCDDHFRLRSPSSRETGFCFD